MNQFKNKILFILFALIFVFSAFATNAKTQCPAKTPGECVVVEAVAQTASPYLAATFSSYLDNLYQYLLGLVGIAALGAMVYGGVLYIVAAGNPSKLGEAKKWISNAIYGLLLAAFSYVLLYTINPDLVGGFTNLNLDNYLSRGQQPPPPPPPPLPPPPYIYQWAEVPFNQYCIDVLGSGWVDVPLNQCEAAIGPASTATADCCRRPR